MVRMRRLENLKRDIEIFDQARTQKLDREELWDSADTILAVFTVVMDRYRDLKGAYLVAPVRVATHSVLVLFTQQRLDIDKQFQVYSYGMVTLNYSSHRLGC